MSAYNEGTLAYENRSEDPGPRNPYAGNPAQAWLAAQWSLGYANGHANAVEANDDARISNWEDDRDWASGRC